MDKDSARNKEVKIKISINYPFEKYNLIVKVFQRATIYRNFEAGNQSFIVSDQSQVQAVKEYVIIP